MKSDASSVAAAAVHRARGSVRSVVARSVDHDECRDDSGCRGRGRDPADPDPGPAALQVTLEGLEPRLGVRAVHRILRMLSQNLAEPTFQFHVVHACAHDWASK